MALKTDDELQKLHRLGYDGITIGVETGDNKELTFMNKGYLDHEIVEQAERLDHVLLPTTFFISLEYLALATKLRAHYKLQKFST